MPQLEGAYSIQNIVGAWRENGKSYVVLYQYTDSGYNPRSDKFVLYEFVITDTGVVYTQLDRVTTMQWPTSSTPYYNFSSSFVWHSRDGKEHTLVCGLNDNTTNIYRIMNGRFVFTWQKRTLEGGGDLLKYGVTSVNTNGYSRGYEAVQYLYDGNPGVDSMAKAWIPGGRAGVGPLLQITSCGDVNNDGFGDVAAIYGHGTLVIYLGQAGSPSSVTQDDPEKPGLSLTSSEIVDTGSLRIRMHIDKALRYRVELYDLRGSAIGTLLDEFLSTGDYERNLLLPPSGLPSGLYSLRLSDGVRAVDKGILIPR